MTGAAPSTACESGMIALGANLGQSAQTLERAVSMLNGLSDSQVTAASSLYRTQPVGGPAGQSDYCNAVVALQTRLSPDDLLRCLLQIEHHFGRDRSRESRFGARTLDLDILLFGDRVVHEPDLTIPHPRMHLRAFVLIPLCEIAPAVTHPLLHLTASEMLAQLRHPSAVHPWKMDRAAHTEAKF